MRYLIFLVFVVSTTLSAGEIHKWVDEDGNVHYTDAPPVSIKSETVRVQSAPSNPGKALPRLSSPDEASAATGETGNAEIPREQANIACQKAKGDLEVIETSSRIKLKYADGTSRYMTDDEVDERKQRSQADIDRFCN